MKLTHVLIIIGLLLAGYLSYLHLNPGESTSCDLSSWISCSSVHQSSYAYFFGAPVAFLGVLGFLAIGAVSMMNFQYKGPIFFGMTLGGMLFMLYLTAMELFMIKAICLYCVMVALVMVGLFILVAREYGGEVCQLIELE